MHCPKCDIEMTVMREDISFNTDGTQYARKIYKCVKDDIWITVETPTSSSVA